MGFFVLEREVAGIVSDAEVRVDEPFGGLFGAELLEETQRFRRVLGVADRLRLGLPMTVTGEQSRRVLSVMEAATISAADSGRPVVPR